MNTTKNEAPTFVTPDLYLSAFLLARGHRIASVAQINAGRFAFEFNPDVALESDKDGYSNNAAIGIRDLVGAVFTLKRVMRETEARNR